MCFNSIKSILNQKLMVVWIGGLHIHNQFFKTFQKLNSIIGWLKSNESFNCWENLKGRIWDIYLFVESFFPNKILVISNPLPNQFLLCFLQLFEVAFLLQVFHPNIKWSVLFVNLIHLCNNRKCHYMKHKDFNVQRFTFISYKTLKLV